MTRFPLFSSLKHFSNSAKLLPTLLLSLLLLQPLAAIAAVETVKLKQLRVDDVVVLPTVRSQRVLAFTKPKTWNLSGSSHIEVVFQHSLELDPSRSWLQVAVNNKVLTQVPLGPNNAKGTVLKVPLPVGALKDQNTLTFRVQQHYKAKCEDPLDPSLWTQILPESKIVFDYSPALPKVDLAQYPYPAIDPLTYSPQPLHYILPSNPDEKELLAMGYLNLHLAQSAGTKEVRTTVGYANEAVNGKEHLIYVGTPTSSPAIANYASQAKQGLSGDAGLVMFFAHPTYKDRAVIIATGNTSAGVLQAAKYLTTRPMQEALKGQSVIVPESWNPPGGDSSQKTSYIENQSRTLNELGYREESVEKIFAPPITYKVPVVADFTTSNAKLLLDLVYSYGHHGGDVLNPKFSSLEVRLNDMPIANIPLLQSDTGESMAHAQITLPKELIQPNNKLVAQYHMLPDKFGWCKDSYDDQSWGKIHDNTQFRVEGTPGSLLPSVGLLNYTAFPYSRDANYKNTHFLLPKQLSKGALNAYLAMTSRLGRATYSDTDIRFSLSQGESVPYKTKDLIVVEDLRYPYPLPAGSKLSWASGTPLMQKYALSYPEEAKVTHERMAYENGAGAYLEQYTPGWNGGLVVTVIAGLTDASFNDVALLLEDDERFAKLTPGPIKLLSHTTGAISGEMNTAEPEKIRIEKSGIIGSTVNWWSWLTVFSWPLIIGIAVVLAVLLILLPLILRRARNRY